MVIHTFEEMLSLINSVSFGTEKYYSLQEAFVQLKEIGDRRVQVENAIITPFYVDSNARQELYTFELTMAVKTAKSPIETFLKKRTGHADLSQVDASVISRLKHCYLEAVDDNHSLSGDALAQYCSFLFTSDELKKEISEQLKPFDPSKLYFSYYSETQERFV